MLFFKKGETIPLSPRAFKDAFSEAHKRLFNGSVVAIFPEGGISKDGEFGLFHKGYELIPKDYDGVIIPFYIDSGIFGSVFTKYKKDNAKRTLFRRRVINIYFGSPLDKNTVSSELKEILIQMREKHETK